MADESIVKTEGDMQREIELPPTHPYRKESISPPPPCWWCRIRNLCCGWMDPNGFPLKARAYDCLAAYALWSSGAYQGATFNRERYEKFTKRAYMSPDLEGVSGVYSVDTTVPSTFEPGLNIPVRIFKPKTMETPKRVLYFCHGGGWCVSHPSSANYHRLCNKFALQNYLVISVDYRLAPEHPFPAGLYDAYDVLRWIASKPSDEFMTGADFSQVVLAGDSAGANFCCVLSSLVRDGLSADLKPLNLNIRIAKQILFFPGLMMERFVKPSDAAQVQGDAFLLSRPVIDYFFLSYIPGNSVAERRELVAKDRRLCPLLAGVHNLPRTIMLCGLADPLRFQHAIFAEMIQKCGSTKLVYQTYPHQPHGFTMLENEAAKHAMDIVYKELADV